MIRIYITLWFCSDDGTLRIAGVYLSRKKAEARLEELDFGCVQRVILGKPVRFTHELEAHHEQEAKR